MHVVRDENKIILVLLACPFDIPCVSVSSILFSEGSINIKEFTMCENFKIDCIITS